MKIAIDVSPLEGKFSMQHRVRGTGFYLKNLRNSLTKYFNKDEYTFFTRGEKIPKKVDLVHYPYFEPFFLTLPFLSSYPFIVTVHDLTPLVFRDNFPVGLKGKIKWNLQVKRLKKARRIITDSNSSKNDIAKLTGIEKERIDVVYLASGENFKNKKLSTQKINQLRDKYSLPEKFALYVGDVTWNKNLPRLIEGAVMAKVPLVLAGKTLVEKNFDKSNPWNQDLLKTQKLSDENKRIVKRLGFVDDDDLADLYNLATLFAMPSLYEGFGLPILEAMSCGCPVITSKEGSVSEVAGDSAYFINPYDVNEISEGLKKVFNDKKLQIELSKKGLDQAKKFSWKKTAEKTNESYRRALGI